MRTVETRVYKYEELPEAGKQAVRADMLTMGYHSEAEAIASLKAFADAFCTWVKYDLDFSEHGSSHVTFDPQVPMTLEEIELELSKLGSSNPITHLGLGDCKLTGWWIDEPLLDGMRIGLAAGETDLETLLELGFKRWMKICREDYKYQFSEESIQETCEANEMEFYEDGKPVESSPEKTLVAVVKLEDNKRKLILEH